MQERRRVKFLQRYLQIFPVRIRIKHAHRHKYQFFFFCSTASTLQNLCHKHTSFSKSSRDTDHIYKIYLTTHLSFVVFMLIKGAFNFQIIKRSFFLLLLSRMVFIKKQIHPDSLALMVMAPMDPTTISPSDYHLSHPQYLSDAISSKQIERWISKLISSCTYQSQGENVSINKRQHGFFPLVSK